MALPYRLVLFIYRLGISLAALRNQKARKWIAGRKNWRQRISRASPGKKTVWVHAASLGEFEQARPMIELLKKENHEAQVVITFFSPSGFEVRKNYSLADAVYYLPIDSPGNACDFIKRIKPSVAVFVKYDFWYYYFRECKEQKIPLIIASARFRKGQVFFKWYGGFFRKTLKYASRIFTQDPASVDLLKSIGVGSEIAGDTRYDRVYNVVETDFQDSRIKAFCAAASKVIVFGSTYPVEHRVLLKLLSGSLPGDVKVIIAPHSMDPGELNKLSSAKGAVLYSSSDEVAGKQAMVIDTIGKLSYLYRFCSLAYVGGGFTGGLHNSLEAAVYGIPVVVGPNHHKFPEVAELIAQGSFYEVKSPDGLLSFVAQYIQAPGKVEDSGSANKQFVESRRGASEKIAKTVLNYLPTG